MEVLRDDRSPPRAHRHSQAFEARKNDPIQALKRAGDRKSLRKLNKSARRR